MSWKCLDRVNVENYKVAHTIKIKIVLYFWPMFPPIFYPFSQVQPQTMPAEAPLTLTDADANCRPGAGLQPVLPVPAQVGGGGPRRVGAALQLLLALPDRGYHAPQHGPGAE